jgi:tRNA threonylcarbamoyladenosine biosynthesis protein TsaE
MEMKIMVKIYLENEVKTQEIGYKLGNLLTPGSVICLIGDLGAGKTTMTQSLAKALEVDDYIISPTFTIVNEYEGKMPLYHFDVYRIGSSEEMYDIGFDEYIDGEGVCIIEWANLIEDILPDEYLYIEMNYKETGREMILTPKGEKYEEIVKELSK